MTNEQLKTLREKALIVIKSNHRLDLGYEREVMAADKVKNPYEELSDAIPQSFKDVLNLLIQCDFMNVVCLNKAEKFVYVAKIVGSMDNWNGLRLDVKIYEEDKN